MKRKHEAAHPLLENRNLLLSISFVVFLSVLGNGFFELLKGVYGTLALPLGVSILGITGLAIILSRTFRGWWKEQSELTALDVEPELPRRRARVAFVSKGPGSAAARDAALYHLSSLEHLWLIASAESAEDALRVMEEVCSRKGALKALIVVLSNVFSHEAAEAEVQRILDEAIHKFQIPEKEVVYDFTSSTRPASAGMISACAFRDVAMQYMHLRIPLGGTPDAAAGRSFPVEFRL